jgi:hypothetical protein
MQNGIRCGIRFEMQKRIEKSGENDAPAQIRTHISHFRKGLLYLFEPARADFIGGVRMVASRSVKITR